MKKRRPKPTPLDINRCPQGYYWVRIRGTASRPKIMELRDDGQWWNMAWDIPERNMQDYEVLAPVEKYKP